MSCVHQLRVWEITSIINLRLQLCPSHPHEAYKPWDGVSPEAGTPSCSFTIASAIVSGSTSRHFSTESRTCRRIQYSAKLTTASRVTQPSADCHRNCEGGGTSCVPNNRRTRLRAWLSRHLSSFRAASPNDSGNQPRLVSASGISVWLDSAEAAPSLDSWAAGTRSREGNQQWTVARGGHVTELAGDQLWHSAVGDKVVGQFQNGHKEWAVKKLYLQKTIMSHQSHNSSLTITITWRMTGAKQLWAE